MNNRNYKDDRYSRQRVLSQIGSEGQEMLLRTSILVIGCGALGSVQAQLLARAGVGRLLIIDRDVLEENNLQRQLLYDEEDVTRGYPKAEAACRKLRKINSTIEIEGLVKDVTPKNIEGLLDGIDLVLDGTDNFETRYLINDSCVKRGTPWIYGGAIAATGMVMAIDPDSGPCLRCLFATPPPPGSLPTCDTMGVLNTTTTCVASVQVTEAIKLIVGKEKVAHQLLTMDLWANSFRAVSVNKSADCPCCGQGRYDYLDAKEVAWTVVLCGRNAIQITPAQPTSLSLDTLRHRLNHAGKAYFNGLLLQFEIGEHLLTIFPDGRTIIKGTTDEAVAKGLYAKYVGG